MDGKVALDVYGTFEGGADKLVFVDDKDVLNCYYTASYFLK